jgi:hypothetical protein
MSFASTSSARERRCRNGSWRMWRGGRGRRRGGSPRWAQARSPRGRFGPGWSKSKGAGRFWTPQLSLCGAPKNAPRGVRQPSTCPLFLASRPFVCTQGTSAHAAVQHPAPGLLPRGTLPRTAVAGFFRRTRGGAARPSHEAPVATRTLGEKRYEAYIPIWARMQAFIISARGSLHVEPTLAASRNGLPGQAQQ